MIKWLSWGSGILRVCGGRMLRIAWRTAGSRRTVVGGTNCGGARGFGISGRPESGNAAPSRPCENSAMRRFVVVRPVPGISHPVTAYCLTMRERMAEWERSTYEAFLPKQLDQLPVTVFVCPRCGLNLHEHGLSSPHPLLEFVHRDGGPRRRKG